MLKNVVVFLTGGAGSLGSATAKKLITEGCKVTLFDLPDSRGAEIAQDLGPSAMFCPGDVTVENEVVKALDATTKTFGNLRTLINCAAVHRAGEVYNFNKNTPMKMDHMENVMKVNVLGTVNVIRLALSYMNQTPVDKNDIRGLVLNTSGFASTDGQSGQLFLASAWGAIDSMTLPLCRELGNRGIRVMTIAPGLMETNLTSFIAKRILQSFAVLTPTPKRLGRKEEFADLIVAVMQNNFLNGEVIRLNGGLRMSF